MRQAHAVKAWSRGRVATPAPAVFCAPASPSDRAAPHGHAVDGTHANKHHTLNKFERAGWLSAGAHLHVDHQLARGLGLVAKNLQKDGVAVLPRRCRVLASEHLHCTGWRRGRGGWSWLVVGWAAQYVGGRDGPRPHRVRLFG